MEDTIGMWRNQDHADITILWFRDTMTLLDTSLQWQVGGQLQAAMLAAVVLQWPQLEWVVSLTPALLSQLEFKHCAIYWSADICWNCNLLIKCVLLDILMMIYVVT